MNLSKSPHIKIRPQFLHLWDTNILTEKDIDCIRLFIKVRNLFTYVNTSIKIYILKWGVVAANVASVWHQFS